MSAPAAAWSISLQGLDGTPVEVEAAIGGGLPRIILVGLPDAALHEAKDRCKAAVTASGAAWPSQLVTINLTPAALPKAGTHYDLSIVAAVWAAADVVPRELAAKTVFLGELGLGGRVRAVRGLLPALICARKAGFERAVVPVAQASEAHLVDGISVYPVEHLADLHEFLHGRPVLSSSGEPSCPEPEEEKVADLADVVGQIEAKWALEVAACGAHHVFFTGPPGVGKTMLAERLPGLLPQLTPAQALEVAAIRSVAQLSPITSLPTRPPLSAPHHSATMPSVIGGGARLPQPGSVSLAHHGVLFLDEAPEFSPRILEGLRTPLESGVVTIGRVHGQATYPARFQLVLASNPCPCGMAQSTLGQCECAPMAVRRYQQRVSGPILDRVDIRQPLRQVRRAFIEESVRRVEPTGVVAARVAQGRARQRARLHGTAWTSNADVSGSHLRKRWPVPEGIELVEQSVARGLLSSRGMDKVVRLAWSIADLAGRDRPRRDDVAAAIGLRRGQGGAAA